MAISNKLWLVSAKREGSSLPIGRLWILATDAEVASRKARRWMKRNDYFGYQVTNVESHGTIDEF